MRTIAYLTMLYLITLSERVLSSYGVIAIELDGETGAKLIAIMVVAGLTFVMMDFIIPFSK